MPEKASNIHYLVQDQTRGKLTLSAEKREKEEGDREDVIHSAFVVNVTSFLTYFPE